MLEKLGKKRVLLPIAAVLAVFCLMSLIAYPLLTATPRNVPMGVVSLDQGVSTPKGDVNAGQAMVEAVTARPADSADSAAAPVAWQRFESESQAMAAVDAGEVYGALVIPEDFSAAQVAAAQSGEPASVSVVINQGKNPSIAQILQGALTQMTAKANVKADISMINAPNVGGGAMSSLMGVNMAVMPLFIMTLLISVTLWLTLRPTREATRMQRTRAFGIQLAYGAAVTLLAATSATLIVAWVGGLTVPVGTMIPFLWLASFAVMSLFLGALSLAAPLGIAVIFACFSLGLSTVILAREMLPPLWADYIYPWAPQRFIGEGLRSIVYMNGPFWNGSCPALLVIGGLGLLAFLMALMLPTRKPEPLAA